MHAFTSIPFKTETAHGLKQVNGVAKFSAAGIVLEFESKLFGLISDGVKEARISIDQILDIKFRKGVFKRGARIEIRSKSMSVMAGLPNDDGKLVLKLKPEDFNNARAAVERLGHDLKSLLNSTPPPRASVAELFDESEADTAKPRH